MQFQDCIHRCEHYTRTKENYLLGIRKVLQKLYDVHIHRYLHVQLVGVRALAFYEIYV